MLRLALSVAVLFLSLHVSAEDVKIMPLSEVKPGMKGIGKTVFSGTKVETFEAEVLSVLRNVDVQKDLILMRLSGGPLERTGLIAGMSGSPVYIDGRLIGAVAYGWSFAREAMTGVTPIEEMLALLDEGTPRKKTARRSGEPSGLKQIATPVMIGGMPQEVVNGLKPLFDEFNMIPVQSGGAKGMEMGPETLQPGAALSVQLVSGDLDMAAIGTVTYRKGNTILGFGHGFFHGGEIEFPMTPAYVHGVVARESMSYKLAGSSGVAGTISRDLRPGVAGEIARAPDVLACKVKVIGSDEGQRQYSYSIVRQKLWSPALINAAVASSVYATEPSMADNMIDLNACVRLKGRSLPVLMRNVYFEEGEPYLGPEKLSRDLSLLMDNPFGRVTVDSVDVELRVRRAKDVALLESLRVQEKEAIPGQSITVRVMLKVYQRPSITHDFKFVMPRGLQPGQQINFVAADALVAERFNRMIYPGKYVPVSLEQLIGLIEKQERNSSLAVFAFIPAAGLSMEGYAMPSLPSSLLSVISSSGKSNVRLSASCLKQEAQLPYVVQGMQSAQIVVGEEK